MKGIEALVKESDIALRDQVYACRRALFNMRCRKKVGETPSNVHEPRKIRKEVARLKTALSLRKMEKQGIAIDHLLPKKARKTEVVEGKKVSRAGRKALVAKNARVKKAKEE